MKQFSLFLNVFLIAAVAFLYFKVFSTTKKMENISKAVAKDSTDDKQPMHVAIAYVELDSLNEKITFVKNRRQEFERRQKAIENEWKNGITGLQNKASEFQKNAGSKTQAEAEKLQNELGLQQQQIEAKKQQLTQDLSQESYTFLEDIQKKLKKFIADYNKDKKYNYILTTGTGLDYMIYRDETNNITNEVIAGMNVILNNKK